MDYEIVEAGVGELWAARLLPVMDTEVTEGHSCIYTSPPCCHASQFIRESHKAYSVYPAGLARESSPAAVRALGTRSCFLVTVWSRAPAQSMVSSLHAARSTVRAAAASCVSREAQHNICVALDGLHGGFTRLVIRGVKRKRPWPARATRPLLSRAGISVCGFRCLFPPYSFGTTTISVKIHNNLSPYIMLYVSWDFMN